MALCPEARLNTPPESQPGTASLTFPGRDNALMLGRLDFHGISAAAGSACRSAGDEPSHALLAMGLSPEEARSTLRLSFGRDFSRRDLRRLLSVFRLILAGEGGDGVTILRPRDVTLDFLAQRDLVVIHVKRLPGGTPPLPGSRVAALGDRAFWEGLRPAGPLFLTCEVGYDAPMTAWRLSRRGLGELSALALGLRALRRTRPELWAAGAMEGGDGS
jgi:hypothetical protein